ncbi:cytochrome P450 oxidoreductase GliF [Biscogniauxia marginata]|nr:cytochrome P450 oxidoreductase GliF [Biscogniauxia marginata]
MWSIQTNIIEPFWVIRQSMAPLKLSRWQLAKLFAKQALDGIPPEALILGTTAFLLLAIYLTTGGRVVMPRELPILKGKNSDFEDILAEGRKKYPDRPYLAINKYHKYVVYPPKNFEEIKRLPEETASAKNFFHKVNYGSWSSIGRETHTLVKTILADLTRSIPARVLNRQQDCRMAFESIIGFCPEWKEIPLLFTTFEIVAKINACSFVGRDLGSNQKWVRAVMHSPLFIHVAVTLTTSCPQLLRPLLAPLVFLPTLKNQWDMKRLLIPVLKEDVKEFQETSDKKEILRPKSEGKLPLTALLLSRYKFNEPSLRQLVEDYVLISFDSTPSTASALYHAIYELAAHPSAADVLRQELDEIMVDGKLPSTHLQELRRMDSFLRESLRMHPISSFSLQRVLGKPTQLSSGPTIPAGAIITVDAAAINRSPNLWEEPDKFDMDRFYNKRKEPGNESRYHLLTTGPDSPGWGDGIQACPGRFFASSTLKIALAYVLKNYDVKLRDGAQYPVKVSPMANGSWAPDDKAAVLFKSRE